MNEKLLKIKMVEYDDTQSTLAEALGVELCTLNYKIKGVKSQFKQGEINIIIDRYNLTPEETHRMFFGGDTSVK